MRVRPRFKAMAVMVAAISASALGITVALANFSPSEWRFVKPITLPAELRGAGLVEVVLDRDVFSYAAGALTDLRIIAENDDEVPYQLVVARGERERVSVPAAIRDQGYVRGEYTTFTAEVSSDGALHNEIEIATPSASFQRAVTVEASSDGVKWTAIAEQEIFGFEVTGRGFVARDTRVRYPESTARYLRVHIADGPEGAVEVSGAAVFFTKEVPAREVEWPVSISPVSISKVGDETDGRATRVLVDLGAGGLPSHRLNVGVSDVNFYREVDLQSSADGTQWSALGLRSAIFAYDTPKFVGSNLSISFPEITSRFISITVRHEDNPPFDIESVRVHGIQRTLVFSADPDRSYGLYYGNTEARSPSYDIGRVLPYLETDPLPEARLGEQAANPRFAAELPAPEPLSERLPWLLPSVVGLAAVVVAALLVGVLRQAKRFLPPPPDES